MTHREIEKARDVAASGLEMPAEVAVEIARIALAALDVVDAYRFVRGEDGPSSIYETTSRLYALLEEKHDG